MAEVTVLDEILYGERQEPLKPSQFLELMEERRQNFWDSKPEAERSHYQGYHQVSPEVYLLSLKRQVHAELAAVHAPDRNLHICPWQEIKMDLARQVHEEARHFNLIRDHLLSKGGTWEDDFTPDYPEWQQMFSLFMNLENRFFLDPRKEVVARASALNFCIEGWDHIYVQPLFLPLAQKVDPRLAEIYEDVVMPDEAFHHEIGRKVLGQYCDTIELQRVAIYFADKSMEAHHKTNVHFSEYLARLEEIVKEEKAGRAVRF